MPKITINMTEKEFKNFESFNCERLSVSNKELKEKFGNDYTLTNIYQHLNKEIDPKIILESTALYRTLNNEYFLYLINTESLVKIDEDIAYHLRSVDKNIYINIIPNETELLKILEDLHNNCLGNVVINNEKEN